MNLVRLCLGLNIPGRIYRRKDVFEKFSKFCEGRNGLVFVIILSLALKIVFASFDRPFNSDGVRYISAAQYFASGAFKEGLAMWSMPLFSLIITFVHFIVPDWEIAAKSISLVCAVLAIIPLYLITRDMFGRKAAFWAGLALAISPLANDWALDVLRESVFLFFFLWTVYFAHKAIITTRPLFFLVTIFFACVSPLLRIEGIIIFPAFFFFVISLIILKEKERVSLIKGLSTWIVLPIFIAVACLLIIGSDGNTFNRFYEVTEKAQNILNLSFLDNYRIIYYQLEDLEKISPYPYGRQNFAEIAQHFMSAIYLLGLLEVFVKVMFPLFVIPLFWAYRHTLERTHVFILVLVFIYLLMLYFTLVERDFLQRRFMFAPAVLMYPWVGLGLERMFDRLKSASRPIPVLFVFISLFILSPVVKSADYFVGSDNVLRKAGNWLGDNPALLSSNILSSDWMVPYYAGVEHSEKLMFESLKYDFASLEKEAKAKSADILIIKVPKKIDSHINTISYYQRLKKFTGKKRNVYFYCSPAFCKNFLTNE